MLSKDTMKMTFKEQIDSVLGTETKGNELLNVLVTRLIISEDLDEYAIRCIFHYLARQLKKLSPNAEADFLSLTTEPREDGQVAVVVEYVVDDITAQLLKLKIEGEVK